MNHVAIVSACRTPIGTIGGQFKTLTALDPVSYTHLTLPTNSLV